ncbi:MAG TPA: Fe-S-containing protein [Thermoanaerobaculia bacterium]|nr:Fe-S-containing protein [Thermoanaerobaculia bacterium]
MRRFRPSHGVFVVLLFVGAVVVADLALEGRLGRGGYELVRPGRDGVVRIGLAGIAPTQVHFYRFLNPANQEVRFFVGRDGSGQVQAAFDADEVCARSKRGFRHEGEWVVCNKCDKSFRLSEVNAGGGGCRPIPLPFRVAGEELVVAEADILQGWRLFR